MTTLLKIFSSGPGRGGGGGRCLDVYVHPQTDHTLHSNPHEISTKFVVHCDNLLLLHFDPVTIFYCDILTQSGLIFCTLKKIDSSSQCDVSTHHNLGQPMSVTFFPFLI
jgi:hypothetical protein